MLVKVQRIKTDDMNRGQSEDVFLNPESVVMILPSPSNDRYELVLTTGMRVVVTSNSIKSILSATNVDFWASHNDDEYDDDEYDDDEYDDDDAQSVSYTVTISQQPNTPTVSIDRLRTIVDEASEQSWVNSDTGAECKPSDPRSRFDVHAAWDAVQDIIMDIIIDAERASK